MDSHDKKLAFIKHMTQLGLQHVQHLDSGGTVLGGPANPAAGNAVNTGNGIAAALGLNNNFQAQGANLQAGTNAQQLNNAYQGAQGGLTQQQQLANQLAGQTSMGVDTQTQLTNQLQGIANGTGPNPALTQLNQQTGKNIANQAALAAGQRGASANVGLLARQAAQAGAQQQQQATGQGATLQAQQALQAQQQLANLANQQVGQSTGQVNTTSAANQAEQSQLQSANTALNNANVTMQSNINNNNAATAQANQAAGGKAFGAIAGAAGSLVGLAKGGKVQKFDGGGEVVKSTGQRISKPTSNDSDSGSHDGVISQWMGLGHAAGGEIEAAPHTAGDASRKDTGFGRVICKSDGGEIYPNHMQGPHRSHVANFFAAGGKTGKKVPAMLSPGEKYLSPQDVQKVLTQGTNPLKLGKEVPGKAKVKGDSLKNDIVPAQLEEGGLVLPRHITNKMSREKAELFVHKAMQKHGRK